MTISDFLVMSTATLRSANVDSARLDAELILSSKLQQPREWILAHDDFELDAKISGAVQSAISRRANREPLAYILGTKEFYGRSFVVTPDVLIPRPETEMMIEILREITADRNSELDSLRILDIGTGSGVLAITAKLEFPFARVVATDVSDKALKIARVNAERLGSGIDFVKSDLLDEFQKLDSHRVPLRERVRSENDDWKFDVVLANLPYVDENWEVSPETKFEPKTALFADDNGLKLIRKLVQDAPKILKNRGFLILEMDSRQIETVKNFVAEHNYKIYDERPFTLALRKI